MSVIEYGIKTLIEGTEIFDAMILFRIFKKLMLYGQNNKCNGVKL